MVGKIKEKLKSHSGLKKLILWMIASPYGARPRLWVRLFVNPILHTRQGSLRVMARLDVFPFNGFVLGKHSFVEDFSTINNGVGDVYIGTRSRIGLGSTVIGPISIGDDVHIAQNVVLSGLNHDYEDVTRTIAAQGVNTSTIVIENDVWIGANSVITAGVTIGTHSVVAAGSIVTKSMPPYSVSAGIPAKLMKKYDFDKKEWIKVKD